MTPRVRMLLFLAGGTVLAGLLAWGLAGLPGFGRYPGPYGMTINAISVSERNSTDAVTAVNLDFRGFDTIGEEYILFCSVAAVAVLLRLQRQEAERQAADEVEGRDVPDRDDSLLVFGVAMASALICFGLYIVAHGQLTPGGGFQGGAILMGGLLLVALAGGLPAFRRVMPTGLLDVLEGGGAGAFVVIGLASLAVGAAFLQNVLPTGTRGEVASAGTLPLINAAIGVEVAAGLTLLAVEFWIQLTVVRREGGGR